MHRTVICIISEKNKQKQAQRLMPAGVARKRFLQYPVDATDCGEVLSSIFYDLLTPHKLCNGNAMGHHNFDLQLKTGFWLFEK